MPQYRVEVSPNNRAGCQDKQCKGEAVKILKGEIRFGTWVEMPGIGESAGGWKWKHWGCVSGMQIQNTREAIERNGKYEFDMIDGYDELGDHPDVQAKIRRVIEQGHIDPEDFNGEPAYNTLGSRGIRGRAKKPKEGEDGEDPVTEEHEEAATPAKKPAGGKRGRKAAKAEAEDGDDAGETEPPKKKARQAKKAPAVKAEDEDSEDAGKPESPKRMTRQAKKGAAVKAPAIKAPAVKAPAVKPELEPEVGAEEVIEYAPTKRRGRKRGKNAA